MPLNASLSQAIPEDQQTSGGTYAGWNGVDEFGRLWERGSYIGGVVKNEQDIERYVPDLMLDKRMDPDKTRGIVKNRPDKAFCLSTHTGPFGLTLESIGFEELFLYVYGRPRLHQNAAVGTDKMVCENSGQRCGTGS